MSTYPVTARLDIEVTEAKVGRLFVHHRVLVLDGERVGTIKVKGQRYTARLDDGTQLGGSYTSVFAAGNAAARELGA